MTVNPHGSGLTPSFTLSGLPTSAVSLDEAVGITVPTNSTAGHVYASAVAAFLKRAKPKDPARRKA